MGATRRLWWLAAAVVVLFNLDAAVVLLTPLYVRVARRRGADPLLLGLQPALLACLASGVLPVSNLTNLLAANALHLHASAFVTHLGPPSVVAVTVGWCAYRRLAARHPTTPVPTGPLLPDDPPSTWSAAAGGAAAAAAGEAASGPAPRGGADRPAERAALRRGAPAVVLVLVGFTLGDRAGVPAWVVVALGMLALVPHTGQVPWRAIPHGAILLTAALGVLVAEAAPHLPLDALLGHGGLTGDLAAFGFGAFGSLAANNLPAAQVALGALHDPTQVWPLLVGLDMVPAVLLTASLSNLLWEGTARRLGVVTTGRRFSAVGLRVAVPAALSALLVLLALGRLR